MGAALLPIVSRHRGIRFGLAVNSESKSGSSTMLHTANVRLAVNINSEFNISCVQHLTFCQIKSTSLWVLLPTLMGMKIITGVGNFTATAYAREDSASAEVSTVHCTRFE